MGPGFESQPDHNQRLKPDTRKGFSLFFFYLLMSAINSPLFLIGMMGSGKSHWARQLGTYYGVPVFDTDEMVEELAGEPIKVIFYKDGGEGRFRELEKRIIQQTQWPAGCVVACGGGLPCFHNNMEYMLANGRVLWLNPPVETLAGRLWNEKNHRPLVAACHTREALMEKLQQLLAQRNDCYARATLHMTLAEPVMDDFVPLLQS